MTYFITSLLSPSPQQSLTHTHFQLMKVIEFIENMGTERKASIGLKHHLYPALVFVPTYSFSPVPMNKPSLLLTEDNFSISALDPIASYSPPSPAPPFYSLLIPSHNTQTYCNFFSYLESTSSSIHLPSTTPLLCSPLQQNS